MCSHFEIAKLVTRVWQIVLGAINLLYSSFNTYHGTISHTEKQGSFPLRCPWDAGGQQSGLPVGCPWEFCHENQAAHYFHIWKQWAAQWAAQ